MKTTLNLSRYDVYLGELILECVFKNRHGWHNEFLTLEAYFPELESYLIEADEVPFTHAHGA